MKKSLSILLTIMVLISSFCISSQAAVIEPDSLHASHNISKCYAEFVTSNGTIYVSMYVYGIGTQDKIGVSAVTVEEKVNGRWTFYDSFSSDETQEDFFAYDAASYTGDTSFSATPGHEYRVTISAYARKGTTWDTDEASGTITCK